jgi:hypothetical protein
MADSSSGLIWKTLNGRANDDSVDGYELPTRSSKLISRVEAAFPSIIIQGDQGPISQRVLPSDWEQTLVHDPALYAAGLTDFIYIELKGRGLGGGALRKKFLVNPNTITVHNDVRDSESMTRGGWQVGVWGELGTVNMSGWTAGRYFAGRLVDTYSPFSASYRDLQDLVAVYENNGNFYEGEEFFTPDIPLAASRKQIKYHADVTLAFGNFLWDGYFTDLRVDDMADHPWVSKYTLGFQILAERYAGTSPWRSSIQPDVQYRGHAWELYNKQAALAQQSDKLSQASTLSATLGQGNLAALGLIPTITVVN